MPWGSSWDRGLSTKQEPQLLQAFNKKKGRGSTSDAGGKLAVAVPMKKAGACCGSMGDEQTSVYDWTKMAPHKHREEWENTVCLIALSTQQHTPKYVAQTQTGSYWGMIWVGMSLVQVPPSGFTPTHHRHL